MEMMKMMQATVMKTSTGDYFVNIDENESDVPATPFQCWIAGINEMNALYNSRAEAAEARAAELAAQVAQLTAERDGMRRELQTLVDDIVNFPGHFDRGSESVDAAIEYLAVH